MYARDFVGAVEIGERALHPQHAVIAARGEPHGVGGVAQERERNILNKIGRGSFTAVFFVQRMEAIGCRVIHFDEI
jgi:hypothetical protein